MTDNTKNRLLALLDREIRSGSTAGASLLVRRDGAELFFAARGQADRETGAPIRRDTMFRLYSMTKPVTAAAAMILVQRGELDLDMPICEVLPGFSGAVVGEQRQPLQRPVTVLHLLNMTSGLTYGDENTPEGRQVLDLLRSCGKTLGTPEAVTTVQLANCLGEIPLAFQPDSAWCYGFSADVLGAVIEQVSGRRFGEFLQTELFAPLNMNDTGFYVPEEKQHRLAKVYDATPGGLIEFTENHLLIDLTMAVPPAFESGGAGLVSTIDDYARLAQMLLNGGILDGARVLSPRTTEYLLSGNLTAPQQRDFRAFGGKEGYTYSHLMRRLIDPGQACLISSAGEYGWAGWLGCYFANLPRENMTVLLMQQKAHSGARALARGIMNVIAADLESPGDHL